MISRHNRHLSNYDVKKHFKMYKAGKRWLFAGISLLTLGTGFLGAQQMAHGDTVNSAPVTQSAPNKNQTSVSDKSAQSAVIQSGSSASQAKNSSSQDRTSSSTSSMKQTSTSAENQKQDSTVTTKANVTVNKSVAVSGPASSAVKVAVANSSQTSQTSTATTQAKSATASTAAKANSSTQSIVTSSVASVVTSVGTNQAVSVSPSHSQASSDAHSIASLATRSVSTASQTANNATKSAASSQASTTATNLATSTTASAEHQSSLQAQVATLAAPAIQNLKTISLIDPNKFVKGTKVTTQADGTLIVSLPAGASAEDIQQAKQLLAAAHIAKVQITAQDAATNEYSLGESAAAKTMAAASYNAETGTNGVDIKEWIGDVDFADLETQLATVPTSTDGTATATMVSSAKTVVDAWAIKELQNFTWTTLSQSAAYAETGNNVVTLPAGASADEQAGYTDTVKAYLQGQLTAEAYYLWLLKVEYNSVRSSYFGPQGKPENFSTLKTDLDAAKDSSGLDATRVNMYDSGFDFAYAWFVGDSSLGDGQMDFGNSMLNEAVGYVGNQNMLQVSWSPATENDKATFLEPLETILDNNALSNVDSVTVLENEIYVQALKDYYATWQNVVAQGFKQATSDALAGKGLALDNSFGGANAVAAIKAEAPQAYKDTPGSSSKGQLELFLYSYILAKAYLSGHYNNTKMDEGINGAGNTSIPDNGIFPTTPAAGQVVSPLDLAIYSVLTGKVYTYDVAPGNKPIVDTAYQASAKKDWISGPAQEDMYQLAWNVANQAKTDFLSDIQLAVNQGDLSKLDNAANFLPTVSNHGALTENQYQYYQANSYVYYKVFSALYKNFFTDKGSKATNIIAKAIADADTYVKQSGDSNNGQPIAQNLADAQRTNSDLIANISVNDVNLNADVTYAISYSENTDGTPVSGVTTLTPAAATTIKGSDISSDNQNNAKKVIQNAIDYAYVHEEAMAIPAYEAGFAAVQKNLNVTPTAINPALGSPVKDTYSFENKSTVTDSLTPALSITNPDGSTVWNVHYSNADGTNTIVTINRANAKDAAKGAVTGLEVVVKDAQGNALKDSGLLNATQANVNYTSLQLNTSVTNDGVKQTTVSVAINDAGTLDYTFVRDALNTVIATPGADGTNSGTLYQAGWDYRKSFISEITLVQQVADADFKNKNVTEDNNKLTEDQTYAGFFQSTNKDGQIVHNSTVQLQPIADVNGAYGTYVMKPINNLDGSKVDITLNTDGSLVYTVYDVNGKVSAANGNGTMAANVTEVDVTNKDATGDQTASYVVIKRTANDAITISETGIQDKMINDLTVTNTQTTADATVVMGKNVEPSFSSTTIVTPVSALHQGVVLTADSTFGVKGIKSTFAKQNADGSITTTEDDANGLEYRGYVTDPKSTDNTKDYGVAENSTTTIQYVANNVSNSATGTIESIDITTAIPSVTIQLGKDSDGSVKSTTSYAVKGATANNTGSSIFDFNSVKNLPAGWSYNATKQTLTYTPQNDTDKATLLAALAKGSYTVNFSGEKGATAPALLDKYNDVMNLVVDASVKSQNSLTQTIDTSDTTQINAQNQYTFSNAAIVAATKANDPSGLVTAFLKQLAGTAGKTYTSAMNGLDLPKGVGSVTLNADGSVTVTYNPSDAAANYDAKTNTNTIKLVLPFTVDSNNKYIVDTTDTTGKTPLANLTLNMNMETQYQVKYLVDAGGKRLTLKDGTVINYVGPGGDAQAAIAKTTVILGADIITSAPATITSAANTNYNGADYILLTNNSSLSKNPGAITDAKRPSQFGDNNTITYTYAKSAGFVWNTTENHPYLTDSDPNSQDTGLISSVDINDVLDGFDKSTLKFTPEQNPVYPNIIVGTTLTGTLLNFTNTNNSDDPAALAKYASLMYRYGFGTSGWLTDGKGHAMYLYIGSDTIPTKNPTLPESDVTINITDPSTSGTGYQIGSDGRASYTFDFDLGDKTLTKKQLMAVNSGISQLLDGETVRDFGQDALTIIRQFYDQNATEASLKEWQNLSTIKLTTTADGHGQIVINIAPTMSGYVSKQNAAQLFLATNNVTSEDSIGGVQVHLNFTTNLIQDSEGVSAGLKPSYDAVNNQKLGTTYTIQAKKVVGYHVTGAKDQNGNAVDATKLIINADGTATYNGTYDWGIAKTGDTKPLGDEIIWQYAQDDIIGAIGNNSKTYGMADPTGTNIYPLTGLPVWLTGADKLTDKDFTRVSGEKTGQYAVTLNDQGIKDLQTANPNYTLNAATLSKLTSGYLQINAAPVTATANTATRTYNGQSIDGYKNSDGQAYYVPELTFTITDPKNPTATPQNLSFMSEDDYDYTDAAGNAISAKDATSVGTYTWKLNDVGKTKLYKALGSTDGKATDVDFSIDPTSLSGTYEITAAALTATTTNGTRVYDGTTIATNHKDTTNQKDETVDFAPAITFKLADDKSTATAPSAITLTYADLTFTKGTDEKNADTYVWTVNATGLAKLYAALGQVVTDGKVTKPANFSLTESQLTGKYTISKAPVTITGRTVSKTYDGSAYTGTGDQDATIANITDKPAEGDALVYTLTDLSKDVDAGTYDITVATKDTDNANYTIKVAKGLLTINKQPLTTATPNTPTTPVNSKTPNDNTPVTGSDQDKTSLTLIGKTKVYDGDASTDPLTYTVQKPSQFTNFTIPELTADDFDLSGINSQNVGSYTVKLSNTGLLKLQNANKNYSFTKDDIQDGLFVITAQTTVPAAIDGSKTFNNVAIAPTYMAGLKLSSTKATNLNLMADATADATTNPWDNVKLTNDDVIYKDQYGTVVDPTQATHAGAYTWTIKPSSYAKIRQELGSNYSVSDVDLAVITGSYTINQGTATTTTNSAARNYDGLTLEAELTDGKGTTFKPTITFDTASDLAVYVVPAGDFSFTDASKNSVDASTVSDAGTYTWQLTAAGLKHFYASLGSRAEHDYSAADMNYKLTGPLTGTYTINPVAITITAPTVSKVYDGNAYTDATATDTKPAQGKTPEYTLTDLSNDKDVSATGYPIDVTLTANSAINKNYTITVAAGKLTITPATATGTLTNGNKIFNSVSILTDFTPKITITNGSNSATVPSVTLKSGDYLFTDKDGAAVDETTENHVGTYTWKLTDAGIKDVQAKLGNNFSATGLDKLTGSYEIKQDTLTPTTNSGSRDYNGKTITDSHDGYTPTITLTLPTGDQAQAPNTVQLDMTDIDYQAADNTAANNAKNVGTYTWKVNATGLAKIYQKLGSQTGIASDANFKLDESKLTGQYTVNKKVVTIAPVAVNVQYDGNQHEVIIPDTTTTTGVTGEKVIVSLNNAQRTVVGSSDVTGAATNDAVNSNYTINVTPTTITVTAAPLTAKADNGARVYDGNDLVTNHQNGITGDYKPTITFALSGKDNQAPTPKTVQLDFSDLTVTQGTGVKNVGTYNWTVNADGLKKIYQALGSQNGEASDANYSINTQDLAGTYAITQAPITITAPTLTKTYNGHVYTPTDDQGKTVTGSVTGLPANGIAPAYTLTDISQDIDAGTYPITVAYTAEAGANANYKITVVAGSLTISKRTLTPATPNTPTNPVNPSTPADNRPNKDTPQAKSSLTIIGKMKVYDNNAATDPTIFTVQGPSDDLTFVVPTLTGADFDTTGINSQNIGSYIVKLSTTGLQKIQTANAKNFTVDANNVQDALFVITKRPVTVTADNQTKVFGSADPAFTKTVSGDTGDSNSGLISGDQLDVTVSRQSGENPGDYTLNVTNGDNSNYTVTDNAGTLTIYPAVTIQYVDQDGKPLTQVAAKKITDQKVAATITVDHPTVANYTLENQQPSSYVVTGDGSQTVTVRYRQNAAVTANYYLVGTTQTLAPAETTNGGVGLAYTTTAVKIVGYTLVKQPTNATGQYTADKTVVNYYYLVDYSVVPTLPNGNPIPRQTPKTGTGNPGEPVKPTGGLPSIPGYTLTTTPNVPNQPGTVNVVYTPNTENVKVNYYLKGTTTPIKDSETLTGPFGSAYQTSAANVAGYTLVGTPSNQAGTYELNNADVDYYYTVNYTAVPVDNLGQPIPGISTTTGTGNPGDPLTSLPTIPGYTLTTMPTVPGKPGQVNVVYTPQRETVMVYYVDQDGKQLHAPLTMAGAYGSQYSVTALTFNNYYLEQTEGQTSGKYGLQMIVITYHYRFNQTSQAGSLPSQGSTSPSNGPSMQAPSGGSETPKPAPSTAPGSESTYPINPPKRTPHTSGETSQVASLTSNQPGRPLSGSQAISLAGTKGHQIQLTASQAVRQGEPAETTRQAKATTRATTKALPSRAKLPQTAEADQSEMMITGILLTFGLFTYLGVRKYRRQPKSAQRIDDIGRLLK